MPAADFQETTFDRSLNLARQALYRFTSLCFLDPKQESWERLDALRGDPILFEAAQLIRELPEAKPKELGRGERPLECLDPLGVLRQLPDSPAALNAQYERTFGLLVSNACPPYETEYIDSQLSFQRSNTMADLSGFYQAFGLTTSAAHPERSDHIVLELEFMAFLLGLQRRAEDDDARQRNDRVEVCHSAQASFLKEHLAWWTPAFARLLGRENSGGFYEAAGVFLAALIPAERAILRVALTASEVQPSVVERPEECSDCQLNG
jgi:TorA maturation chaperone TorD